MTDQVYFKNSRGLKLAGLLDGSGSAGVVLINHFTGFKEAKHLYKLAAALGKEKMCALRFDFSDCLGESEGKCEDMKVLHQVQDVVAAISFLKDQGCEKIALFGHSLGGMTALVVAAEQEVDAIVVAAALAKLEWDTLFKEKAPKWKEQGYITFSSWKKGDIKIDYGFYKDLQKYDATDLVKKIKAPLLVIQPGEDELISMQHAEGIFENANNPKDFQVVKGSDHMFSKKEHEAELVRLTVDWMKEHLS